MTIFLPKTKNEWSQNLRRRVDKKSRSGYFFREASYIHTHFIYKVWRRKIGVSAIGRTVHTEQACKRAAFPCVSCVRACRYGNRHVDQHIYTSKLRKLHGPTRVNRQRSLFTFLSLLSSFIFAISQCRYVGYITMHAYAHVYLLARGTERYIIARCVIRAGFSSSLTLQ